MYGTGVNVSLLFSFLVYKFRYTYIFTTCLGLLPPPIGEVYVFISVGLSASLFVRSCICGQHCGKTGERKSAAGENRPRHSRCMRNLQFYASAKRPLLGDRQAKAIFRNSDIHVNWLTYALLRLDRMVAGAIVIGDEMKEITVKLCGESLMKANNAECWCVPCSQPEQAVDQTFELLVIWSTGMLTQRHLKDWNFV